MLTRFACATLYLVSGCALPRAEMADRVVITMGTQLGVRVTATTCSQAEEAAEASIQAVLAADQRWSSWRADSVLRRLHDTAVGVPTPVDARFLAGLHLACRWSDRTGGAFDPAIGRLLEAWGVRRGPAPSTAPCTATIALARAASGMQHFLVGKDSVTRQRNALLAEGGFVKGLAIDDAIRTARRIDGVAAVNFDFGGQLAWWYRDGEPGSICVANPDRRDMVIGSIELPPSGSAATSGNSERAIHFGGIRYSHILDPRTGRPVDDWGAVTVVVAGDDYAGCAADCLSTALFVLGPIEGLKLATELPGVEALFLERTAGGFRSHRTPGLRGSIPLESPLPH
jgi:thiamine biosynthesis lipoprotein